MAFKFISTHIPGVVLIEPPAFQDARGAFTEISKSSAFKSQGLPPAFSQIGRARSLRGVVRGMHYQLAPHAQARLISVLRGEILDVAVDIRRASPTYGHWVAEPLSSGNNRMLFIPEGFAHGYSVVSDEAEVLYLCTGEYAPEAERNFAWNDPALGIPWPVSRPLLSPKDAAAPVLAAAENNY